MAFTLVQHNLVNTGSSLNSVTPTWAQSTAAGNLGVACIIVQTTGQTIANSQGWSQAATVTNSSQTAIWYKANLSAGEANPTFSWASAVGSQFGLLEFSGVATSSPLDKTGTSTATGTSTTTTSLSASTTAADDLIVGFCGDKEGNTSGITWSASGFNPSGGADIDAINPPKGGQGSRTAWNNQPLASGSSAFIQFFLSAGTNTALAGVIAAFFAATGGAAQIWQPSAQSTRQAVTRASIW